MKNQANLSAKFDTKYISHCKRTQRLRTMYLNTVPPLYNPSDIKEFLEKQEQLSREEYFDHMMERNNQLSMNEAMEPILCTFFAGNRAVIWIHDIQSGVFYSNTLGIIIENEDSLVYAAARARIPINCASIDGPDAQIHLKAEPNSPQLIFPLYISNGPVVAVAHISREEYSPAFNDDDMRKAAFLCRKYSIYGSSFQNMIDGVHIASMISKVYEPNNAISSISKVLCDFLNTNEPDFWVYYKDSNQFYRYDGSSSSFKAQKRVSVGIVGYALMTETNIMERSAKFHSNYCSTIDGDPKLPILVGVHVVGQVSFATALRNHKTKDHFSVHEKKLLSTLMPFISRTIGYSFKLISIPQYNTEVDNAQITELIKIAPYLVSPMSSKKMFDAIEKSIASIFQGRFIRLFLVENGKVFYPNNNKGPTIESPVSECVIGQCVKAKDSIQYINVTQNSKYNPIIDSCPNGFNNLLTTPIFNSNDEVIGIVSVFCSDTIPYNDSEISRLSGFAVFCGISIQNSIIYNNTMEMVNFFMKIINQNETNIQKLASIIFQQMQKSHKMRNFSIYSLLNEKGLSEIYTVGTPIDQSHDIRLLNINWKSTKTLRFPSSSEKETYSNLGQNQDTSAEPIKSLELNHDPSLNSYFTCSPLFNEQNSLIGVCQMCYFSSGEDIFLAESYNDIASFLLMKAKFTQYAEYKLDQDFLDIINQNSFSVNSENIFIDTFDSSKFNKYEQYQVVFHVYKYFDLISKFNIEPRILLSFLKKLDICYQSNSNHDFNHAIDVFQHLSMQIHTCKLHLVLTQEELLSLLIASLAHDADHDGFSQLNAGLMYEMLIVHSPQERRHCAALLTILNDNESNILTNIPQHFADKIIKMSLDMILATDMSKHFDIIQSLNNNFKSPDFSFEKDDIRRTTMHIMLKAADIGIISRPNRIFDGFSLSEEFFAEGNVWGLPGIEFLSNDQLRKDIHWGKSMRTFLHRVCQPTYDILAKVLPDLSKFSKIVQDNIANWKAQE